MLPDSLSTSNIPTRTDTHIYRDYYDIDVMKYDIEAINTGIGNVLTTRKGSIPGKPRFGSELYKIPFEFMDYVTKNTIKLSITNAIKNWEPRITISEVLVTFSEEYNSILADVSYTYTDNAVTVDGSVTVSLSEL